MAMEDLIMKNFLKGLASAFTGFSAIALLGICIELLIKVWFMTGYIAVILFLVAICALIGDIFILYMVGRIGAYAEGDV
jgi:hypothetical protein